MGQSDLSPTTRLGAALAADPDLFERLVAGDAVFARLRTVVGTPTADKLTLDDAACVAGRDVAMLLAIARGEQAPASKGSEAAAEISARPDWADESSLATAHRLDTRPIFERREHPLAAVVELSAQVPPAGLLVLDCPFDPLPLRRLLIQRGFAAWGERIEDEHWRIWFRQDAGTSGTPGAEEAARLWQQDGVPHIDVRGLAAPEPLLAVVRLIESGETGNRAVVLLDREPVYLYPELGERGWSYRIEVSEPGLVRLSLSRDNA